MTIAGATPVSSRRRARSARADASGSTRQQHDLAAAPALEASTPAFAQTKPWWRAADQHAGPRAHDLAALAQDDLDQARVLAVLGAERERPLARLDVRRARRRGPRSWRRPCARRRARRPAARCAGSRGGAGSAASAEVARPAARSASGGRDEQRARSSPGRTSGMPAVPRRRSLCGLAARRLSMPRVCAAPPRRLASAMRSAARSSTVSTSSASVSTLDDVRRHAARRPRRARAGRGCRARTPAR